MAKLDQGLVKSPVTDLLGTPSKSGSGSYITGGEPGLPQRTPSGNACPEIIYDKNAPLPAPKGK